MLSLMSNDDDAHGAFANLRHNRIKSSNRRTASDRSSLRCRLHRYVQVGTIMVGLDTVDVKNDEIIPGMGAVGIPQLSSAATSRIHAWKAQSG